MVRNFVGIHQFWLVSSTALCIAGMTMSSAMAQETKLALPVQERPVSLLERMQDEVASIAALARPCIVTIEDARAVAVSYDNSALRKTDLKDQIAHLEIDKKAADAEVNSKLQRLNAGTVTVMELQKPKHDQAIIDLRLSALQRRLAGIGQGNALTQQKQDLEARVAELEIDQKFYTDQVKMMQDQVNAGVTTVDGLNEVKRQLAHTEQELIVLRKQRKDIDSRNIFTNSRNTITLNGLEFNSNMQRNQLYGQSDVPKSGSGFSIGEGYIVTTADVVQWMTNPIVTTDDGRQMRATLIAIDHELNIGLIRVIMPVPLPALKLGDSASVVPGHFAISIGNQSGQVNSVALSMVSGIRGQGLTSSTHFYPNLLQIDGTIGAGTSGAPVLNVRGEVIGMVAAALSNEQAAYTYDSASRIQSNNTPLYQNSLLPQFKSNSKIEINPQPTQPGSQNSRSPQSIYGTNTLQDQPKQPNLPNSRGNGSQTTVPPIGQKTVPGTQPTRGRALNSTTQKNSATDNIVTLPGPHLITAPTPTASVLLTDVFVQQDPAVQSQHVGTSSNSGFAIPVNEFKSIIEELKLGKNIVHAWLGFDLEDIDNAREEKGIVRLGRQVRIRGLFADSPAVKAGGTQVGDIITQLNGRPVHTVNETRAAILVGMKPGQKAEIELQHNGITKVVTFNAEARPAVIPPILPPAVPTRTAPAQRR